jgi:hypothetical protein
MNLFTELKSHLDSHVKGVKLLQPLLFQGIPGLRFDLQAPLLDTNDDAYFIEVVKRMDKIHSITTSESDSIMLFYQKYTYKRRKIRKANYLFKQLNRSSAIIQYKRKRTDLYGDNVAPSDGHCEVVIKDTACNINFHNLYVATGNMDFGRIPFLTARAGELYIVNLSRNTVTIMYDDRGCDIISLDTDLLSVYYKELSDLILEVNRPQIIENLQIKALMHLNKTYPNLINNSLI